MQRRISWLVLATTSTIVVAFVIPLCLLVRTMAEDRAMSAADQAARNVATVVAGGADDATIEELVTTLAGRGETTTGVLTASGQVVGAGIDPQDDEVRRALDGSAFTVVDDQGGRVLIPVVLGADTAVVRTSVPPEALRSGVTQAWLSIIGLGLVLMGLAAGIASRIGRRISEPLLDVAGVAHQLRAGDLSARAEVRGTEETEELARALNGLADRTNELLVQERAAVADLSHRLRTPVTALRLDVEAVDDPELARRLGEHIGVLQRSIDAIVHEARRPVLTDLGSVCDAAAVVRDRVAFWRALADDQGRPVTVSIPDTVLHVPVAADDLSDVVDVLLDNVFAHTPEPAGFDVHLEAEDGKVHLVVTDSGPGPEPTRRERAGSTGLGLDIARRTAVGCGGSLTFGRAPGGGTSVEVTLPLVRS
jgi:signal transduction histidine kinase